MVAFLAERRVEEPPSHPKFVGDACPWQGEYFGPDKVLLLVPRLSSSLVRFGGRMVLGCLYPNPILGIPFGGFVAQVYLQVVRPSLCWLAVWGRTACASVRGALCVSV